MCSFDSTTLPIKVCDIECDGDEDELNECFLYTECTFTSCTHDDDVGVTCSKLLNV